jgi:hypothetical protein
LSLIIGLTKVMVQSQLRIFSIISEFLVIMESKHSSVLLQKSILRPNPKQLQSMSDLNTHSDDCAQYHLLGSIVKYCRSSLTFWKNILPPSSGLKNKSSNQDVIKHNSF